MNTETKRHIDAARQVLVGVVPNPTSQIDQITNALIYKFMDDMDQAAIKTGGEPSFFVGELEKYAWTRLMDSRIGNQERMNIYTEALLKLSESKQLPELFRNIFKAAFLPYRSPEVLGLFLKEINYFDYSHSEELGNGYEYLLSIMSSQGDAGQFRTPRHIIDFMVEVVDPKKNDKVLDPACGTAGFLISAYKHILMQHDGVNPDGKKNSEKPLTPDERRNLVNNFEGYDIDPGMVRIAQVNMYLHQFKNPKIFQYDTLSMEDRWNDKFDVILANPPFMSPRGGVQTHNKFSIQSSRSEVLFVDYFMNHLLPKGRAGIIVPEGIIFQSGTAHKQLRKNIVEDGLYAVVSLPSGVFQPYSGVKTSILFFDIELAKQKKEILFVDIKDTGISLGTTQRPTDKNDLIPALKIIRTFQSGEDIETSKLAFITIKQEIIDFAYDLSLTKYRKRGVADTEKPFVSLSDVCSITKGKSSSTKTEPGIYPLYLTAEEYKTADHSDFDGEGVCVPLISATGHGKAAIKRVHYVNGKFALANLLAFVEPSATRELTPKYLFYILNSAKDEMARLMNGAANVSMKTTDLEGFQIPLPSLEIQEQIVAELDGYQNIITGSKQISAYWKPKIDIDPKWEKVKLGEVIEILTDYTANGSFASLAKHAKYTKEKNYAVVVRLTDLRKSMISDEMNYVSEDSYNFLKKSSLFGGEYLIANVGANLGDSYTMPFIKMPATLGPNMYLVKFNQKTSVEYIQIITQQFIKPRVLELSVSATQPKINKDQFRIMETPLPPLATQKQIVERIEAERALVESAKKLVEIYEQKIKDKITEIWDES